MIRDDHRAVRRGQRRMKIGLARHLVPVVRNRPHVRIVVPHIGALGPQQFDHVQRRRLAHVVNVLLIRHTQHQHDAPLERLAGLVQRVLDLVHPVLRHLGVDLASQLDEAGIVVERLELPGEVMRVQWNAMPTHARSRRELHEAVRLGRRGLDHLPHVDPQLVAHDRGLVDQRDVHRPEGVLQQLDHLGRLRRRNRHHPLDHLPVQRHRHFLTRRRHPAHHLRRVLHRVLLVAGVDPLG